MTAHRSTSQNGPGDEVVIERPVIFPHPCNGVMLDPHRETLPIAYYDDERGLIYLDRRHRKLAQEILRARITKSGRWVFQVGGDKKQAEPKDEVIPYWDPKTSPKIGDTQVFPSRRCIDVTYRFDCARLVGGAGPPRWIKRPPITVGQCLPGRETGCFETFVVIGKADTFSDARCTKKVATGDVLHWACLEL